MSIIKQAISFFITLFLCVIIYLLFDIFVLQNGDIAKWGSQMGAFEIGLFNSFFFTLFNMTGHVLFLILLLILREDNLLEMGKTISIISGIGCFLFMVIISDWFYLPDWFQIEIVNDVISLIIGWAMLAFIMTLIVVIGLKNYRKYRVNSGT